MTWGIRTLRLTLSLLVGASAVSFAPAPVAPAAAAVQPCTVSYQASGTPIRSQFDAGKNHSLHWYNFDVQDPRQVTDIDIAVDWTHPDASSLALHLLSPQTTSALVPTIQAVNTNMASGTVTGVYAFDEEVTAAPIAGPNPAAGTYRPATPENALEGHPGRGNWSLWLSNYGNQPGTVRSATLTLTYATCDTDGDGIEERADNCPSAANPDQANSDDDALGDACDLDLDGDSLANAADGCPAVAAATGSGCPTAGRTVRLRTVKGAPRLRITVASPAPGCRDRAEATLFRVRKGAGKDLKLVVVTTNARGKARPKAPRRPGRYYVTVARSYAAGEAECASARSTRQRLTRRADAAPARAADTDGDGLDDALDGCPTVASGNPTGCPSAWRKVALRWLAGKRRLEARVTSPVDACAAHARIKLFLDRRSGPDKLLGSDASVRGRHRFKVTAGARYYVKVSASYSPGVAECGTATSRRVLVPRT